VFDVDNLEVIPFLKSEMERYSMEITGNQIEFVEEIKYGPNWGELVDYKDPK
jgi:hypothetical protein